MEVDVAEISKNGDMEKSPKTVEPVFGKRKIKHSVVLRSPYVNKKTILAPNLL